MLVLHRIGRTVPKTFYERKIIAHRLLSFDWRGSNTTEREITNARTAAATPAMILPSGPAPPTPVPDCNNPGQSIGFSFSPGGLLLPYHMGVADCLIRENYIDPSETLLAGSSAGSIATAAIGCGLDPIRGLEGTISISENCRESGRQARGNLLPLLEEQMESLMGEEAFEFLMARRSNGNAIESDKTGTGIALAYREIFPRPTSHFQTKFENREDLFRAVGYSCMFPFFTTNFPCLLDMDPVTNTRRNMENNRLPLPRLLMDGYFSLPRPQFGCPILQDEFPDSGVDRTVAITCIPQEYFGMEEVFGTAAESRAILSDPPSSNLVNQNNLISINDSCDETNPLSLPDIFRIATQPTSRRELTDLFERGYRDAEEWCRREDDIRARQEKQRRREQ